MSDEQCGSVHPERPELVCTEPAGNHPEHSCIYERERFYWDALDFRPALPGSKKVLVKEVLAPEAREHLVANAPPPPPEEDRRVRSASAPPLGGPGVVGVDHPETSKRSAAKIDTFSQEAQVLVALAVYGPNHAFGLAPYVLDGVGAPIPTPRSNTRVKQLRDKGYIEKVRDADGNVVTAESSPGHRGELHQLTAQGMVEAARILRSR